MVQRNQAIACGLQFKTLEYCSSSSGDTLLCINSPKDCYPAALKLSPTCCKLHRFLPPRDRAWCGVWSSECLAVIVGLWWNCIGHWLECKTTSHCCCHLSELYIESRSLLHSTSKCCQGHCQWTVRQALILNLIAGLPLVCGEYTNRQFEGLVDGQRNCDPGVCQCVH